MRPALACRDARVGLRFALKSLLTFQKQRPTFLPTNTDPGTQGQRTLSPLSVKDFK